MLKLENKMLLLGKRNYISFCENLINKISSDIDK